MTEAEWLACDDWLRMLQFVRDKVSDRKWRLYFCGGCRHITHLFFRPESLAAVEVAERFADGNAGDAELERASWSAESPTFGYEFDRERVSYSSPMKMSVIPRLVEIGALPAATVPGDAWQVDETIRRRLLCAAELAYYCAGSDQRRKTSLDFFGRFILEVDWPGRWLFDCAFGNTFCAVHFDPSWIEWKAGIIHEVAKRIYNEGTFDDLPIIGDALEDAGCTSPEILAHCRTGPHVRGCWVVDLILGKE